MRRAIPKGMNLQSSMMFIEADADGYGALSARLAMQPVRIWCSSLA